MRRTASVIRIEILESLAFDGPLKITHITSKVNVNFVKLENFLESLIMRGLVKEKKIGQNNNMYFITNKGLRAFRESRKQNCMVLGVQ